MGSAISPLLLVVLAVGAGLRVWQYVANTSLWVDEIALARGLLDSSLFHLLVDPLPFNQVAPKGFVLVQKLAVMAFGPSDSVLRLFPFLCSLVSLVVFCHLAGRMLSPVGAGVATLLFATGAPFIVFSGIVKQYSTDVCVALLMWWLACELTVAPVPSRRALWAGGIGAGLVWLSQPAVLMAAALAVPLALWIKAEPTGANRWARLALVLMMWGASSLCVIMMAVKTMGPDTKEYLRWSWAAGFAPDTLARVLETWWPWENLRLLFGPGAQASLAYPLSPLYPVLTALGYGALWRRRRRVCVLIMAPPLLALSAAVVQQYPLSDRLVLFVVPAFILAIGAAIEAIHRTVAHYSASAGMLVAVAFTLPTVYPVASALPPYRNEHLRGVLAHIQANWQPHDTAYVYYGAAPAMTMYAAQYGIRRSDYAVGGCHRGESGRYLEEIDTFRGHSRVWVILTHTVHQYREREDILAYLDAIGKRKDGFVVESYAVGRTPLPAEAYLYDLSVSPSGSDAASFTLTGPASVALRSRCVNGPHVMIPSDFTCAASPHSSCVRQVKSFHSSINRRMMLRS